RPTMVPANRGSHGWAPSRTASRRIGFMTAQARASARAGVLDRLLLLRRELLLTGPAGDGLGIGAGLAAAVDGGQDDAVAGVVEERQAPAQVTADVTEGVVAHDREVAQRVGALGLEGRDLLAEAVDVLGDG